MFYKFILTIISTIATSIMILKDVDCWVQKSRPLDDSIKEHKYTTNNRRFQLDAQRWEGAEANPRTYMKLKNPYNEYQNMIPNKYNIYNSLRDSSRLQHEAKEISQRRDLTQRRAAQFNNYRGRLPIKIKNRDSEKTLNSENYAIFKQKAIKKMNPRYKNPYHIFEDKLQGRRHQLKKSSQLTYMNTKDNNYLPDLPAEVENIDKFDCTHKSKYPCKSLGHSIDLTEDKGNSIVNIPEQISNMIAIENPIFGVDKLIDSGKSNQNPDEFGGSLNWFNNRKEESLRGDSTHETQLNVQPEDFENSHISSKESFSKLKQNKNVAQTNNKWSDSEKVNAPESININAGPQVDTKKIRKIVFSSKPTQNKHSKTVNRNTDSEKRLVSEIIGEHEVPVSNNSVKPSININVSVNKDGNLQIELQSKEIIEFNKTNREDTSKGTTDDLYMEESEDNISPMQLSGRQVSHLMFQRRSNIIEEDTNKDDIYPEYIRQIDHRKYRKFYHRRPDYIRRIMHKKDRINPNKIYERPPIHHIIKEIKSASNEYVNQVHQHKLNDDRLTKRIEDAELIEELQANIAKRNHLKNEIKKALSDLSPQISLENDLHDKNGTTSEKTVHAFKVMDLSDQLMIGCEVLQCSNSCPSEIQKLNAQTGCPICECCQVIECSEMCKYGFEADIDGCPLCRCSSTSL